MIVEGSKIFRKINIILITVLILNIIAISGCTSQNNNSINNYSISDYNQTSSPPSEVNKTLSPSKTVNYEASGYCSYVVDGDTIDVDGVGRIRFVGVTLQREDSLDIKWPKISLKAYVWVKQWV